MRWSVSTIQGIPSGATVTRPKNWQKSVKSYILALPKNSYYLLKTFEALRSEYRYGFIDEKNRIEIGDMIGMAVAKHETGSKNPSKKLIEKVKLAVLNRQKE